ncbi:MAG TPA: FkbM family methyltransferase [Xanthobacteraceae bacterium]|nr:FkbM family methyltransferase [Xanthobacteraceae bacterium]
MREAFSTLSGVLRSLHIYYGNRARRRAMDALYRRFLRPGDLAFDVGAHVGDRVASFRRLGARVVAVEPQPALVLTLRLLYALDPHVVIEAVALGRETGTIELKLNPPNPTVATASKDFIAAAEGAVGWEEQRWTKTATVPLTTLDALIERHGLPRFVKIDVEGFEDEVLAGLTRPLPALSFEFTTIQREVAFAAIARLVGAAPYAFNAALGESQEFAHAEPLDQHGISRWIESLPPEANSGDVYACIDPVPLRAAVVRHA